MDGEPLPEDDFDENEIARRRDELAKRMLSTPPQPLKPKTGADHKAKPKSDASLKKRGPTALKTKT
jgi:hypothetical protein